MTHRWRPGETVILRYALYERMTRTYAALRDDPVNVAGWPYIVLDDTDAETALYLPEGTQLWRWDVDTQHMRPPITTAGDSVRLLYPGACYDVTAYYDTGSGPAPWVQRYFPGATPHSFRHFYGWKVDLVSPYRRTALGYDVLDEVLDIIVRPDRTYYVKDEEQLTHLVQLGIYTEDEAATVRRNAEHVTRLIESAAPPFTDDWRTWRPLASVGPATPPDGWQHLPLAPGRA